MKAVAEVANDAHAGHGHAGNDEQAKPLPMLLIMARRGPTAMAFEMAQQDGGGRKRDEQATLQKKQPVREMHGCSRVGPGPD
jgi:hypothetical protein